MHQYDIGPNDHAVLEHVLGYLNFSSGAVDPQFLAGLDRAYQIVSSTIDEPCDSSRRACGQNEKKCPALWQRIIELLRATLTKLETSQPAFSDTHQAAGVLGVLEQFIPYYREFHRDLLEHRTDDRLWTSFLVGRVFEAILNCGPPWDESDRIITAAAQRLDDYIGHRPVPALESQKIEPYRNEWVRPIPLFIEGADVAAGPYQEIVARALQILKDTDQDLNEAAWFDPTLLTELAVDPRAYDFDHPVNKRPNYHFGHWDPNLIDNKGRYRRFVIRQVTLDALQDRVEQNPEIPRDELTFEAAAVLAGTVLMASGISGSGPDTHDSETTLLSLIPRIATYRDAFYERLLDQLDGAHRERLTAEAQRLRQPFGAARQHLNMYLSRRRSLQLEHVKLARVFSRMGYFDAALRQADEVPVASARTLCRIDCGLTRGHHALDRGDLHSAAQQADDAVQLIKRGIQCGALMDPWNVLGFDGNFSLFPALQNSVFDHRIDDLLDVMRRVFALYSRAWGEASAGNDQSLSDDIGRRYQSLANWWHQFAVHEVTSVDNTFNPLEMYKAAEDVAAALTEWHAGGAEAGDVRFWAPRVESFASPRAYALVVETLLAKQDFVSSMPLMVYWLNQAPQIALESADASFHHLSLRWISSLAERLLGTSNVSDSKATVSFTGDWSILRKFLDYLEANASEYWQVPEFNLGNGGRESVGHDDDRNGPPDDDDDAGVFSAAYESVVFRDSANDGVEGSIFDTGDVTNDELTRETERIVERLQFLETLSRLWKRTALAFAAGHRSEESLLDTEAALLALEGWKQHARSLQEAFWQLVADVESHPLPTPRGDQESLIEYDHRRAIRDSLLEQIIMACVAVFEADQFITASIFALDASRVDQELPYEIAETDAPEDETDFARDMAARILSRVLAYDAKGVPELCDVLMQFLVNREILYVPIAKAGSARKIIAARSRQMLLRNLSRWLPRLGLLTEVRELIETARDMEKNFPVGPGAITQFDELFEVVTRELMETLISSTGGDMSYQEGEKSDQTPDADLMPALEMLAESLLHSWLQHSKTLRLSVLEKTRQPKSWDDLVKFIQTYGGDLFDQSFLHLANLRAILHEGVDAWLTQVEMHEGATYALVSALDDAIPRQTAVRHMTLILESIVENYQEYRDYNSTTTQSDQGSMLFMLLDFLRLRSAYDRVSWNLKPIVLTHEILVREGRNEAAQLWRRALAERIGEEANVYLDRLKQLQEKYAIQLPSVSDRIGQRFMRPMTVDRMCALVEPAVLQAREPGPHHAFGILEDETALLQRQPTGSGLDVPEWLTALEREMERITEEKQFARIDDLDLFLPRMPLPLSELHRQFEHWLADDDPNPEPE